MEVALNQQRTTNCSTDRRMKNHELGTDIFVHQKITSADES
jgi:hypothetical protein